MQQTITFKIYVMSYHRADITTSYKNFNSCTYVVREEEAQNYRDVGISDLLVIPTGAKLKNGDSINGFMSSLYWILENTPEEVVCICDDDITSFNYRAAKSVNINSVYDDYKNIIENEIERLAQIVVDLGLGIISTHPLATPYAFTKEFDLYGAPGSTRIINKPCFKATYSNADPANSDVDMILQEVLKNRIALRCSYFHTMTLPNLKTKGGTANNKKLQDELHLAMKNKWGRYYIYDQRNSISKIRVNR